MSARNDYPIDYYDHNGEVWDKMCDEIDRLRTATAEWMPSLQRKEDVIKALDELISTLTTHADAMRNLIVDLDTEIEQTGEVANMGRYSQNEKAIKKVLKAYDAFVKEC